MIDENLCSGREGPDDHLKRIVPLAEKKKEETSPEGSRFGKVDPASLEPALPQIKNTGLHLDEA